MPAVSPLLDDDGDAEGRTSVSRNSRRSVTEACDGLEAMIKVELEVSKRAGRSKRHQIIMIVGREHKVMIKTAVQYMCKSVQW